MHFPIIKIESIDLKREDWTTDLDLDDACLNGHTDYYGDIYRPKARREVIESKSFKEILDGIATIDTEKETITFLDAGTIRQTLREYLLELTTKLHEKAARGELQGYELRGATDEYKECYTMFYIERGYTCFEFIENAKWHAGETWQIGNIFDAHL